MKAGFFVIFKLHSQLMSCAVGRASNEWEPGRPECGSRGPNFPLEKPESTMKNAVSFVAFVLILGTWMPKGSSQDYRSFQLIYHSDTRGYYNPCG